MTTINWERHQHDTAPVLLATLREPATETQRTGTPVDLSAVDAGTGLTVRIVRQMDQWVVHQDAAALVDVNGIVSSALTADVTGTPGLYGVTFTVDFGGGAQRTFPRRGYYGLLVGGERAGPASYPVVAGQGTGGGGGTADGNYTHTQAVAAIVWTVNHNLDWLAPSVALIDDSGVEFWADIDYVNPNQLTITMATATAGTAYLTI